MTSTMDVVWVLAQRVLKRGEPLELTSDVCALLMRCAQEVALRTEDAEKALRSLPTSKTLLRKISRRIQIGSNRLGRARTRAYRLRDAGNLEGACEQMEKVLAVEVVPLYRQHAENELATLTRLKAVAESGQADPKLPERSQLPLLLKRVQEGKPLELNDGMRAFLRRAATLVAISEAETEEALTSPERAAALLGTVMRRFREGTARIEKALERMMTLRDAGNLEGARQEMRDVLAVEVVPMYRRMAEENLAGLDDLP